LSCRRRPNLSKSSALKLVLSISRPMAASGR